MRIDLHVHTTASDGIYSPRDIVRISKKRGVGVLGIADHDTVGGIREAVSAAAKEDVELVPAVEINSYARGNEYHILGYYLDYKSKRLRLELEKLKRSRIERMHKIIKKLDPLGLNLSAGEVLQISGSGVVGRPHIARALQKKGYVKTLREAFNKYIGEGKPAYEPRSKLSPEGAIDIIREAGGLAVLAHPGLWGGDELIADLAKWGIVGLEVYSPDHAPEQVKKYERIARRFGLIMTGGSDFHGNGATGDFSIGSVSTPVEEFQRLKSMAIQMNNHNQHRGG